VRDLEKVSSVHIHRFFPDPVRKLIRHEAQIHICDKRLRQKEGDNSGTRN